METVSVIFSIIKRKCDSICQLYLVVNPVEVGVETLVEPPAGVADLGADVARVWRAEAVLVVIPAERILHRPTETRHMEAILVLLAVYPAAGGQNVDILEF